ncbi:uncharacterized protein LOC144737135 isoform X2 [Lampetra planeri]
MKGPFRLLVLYGLVTLGTSQVDVDQFVNVNRGQEVTLRCVYTGPQTPGSITWRKVNGDSSVRIAIALPSGYRTDNSTFYGRLNFTNYTSELRNGSIRIEDLRLGDEGDFTCMFATFDDDVQATINLTVNAPPNVFFELNPSQLVDGMGLVTVATCVAQEGKPAASITWSGLHQGSSNETTKEEPDSTVTVRSRYWLEPTYESHGRTLTCRVEHPALESPVEYSTTLNIYCLVTVGTSIVEVEQFVNGSRGEEVTLRCIYTGSETPGSIAWKKGNGDSSVNIAVALPTSYRIYNTSDLYGRLNFTNLNSQLMDGSIRIEDLRLGDKGDFTCAFSTTDDPQPRATISLTVTVTPKVSLEWNPSQLIDGMGLVTVATLIAQEGQPAASITWSGLDQGSSNETTETEPDGTVTVRSRYWLEPTYESHGRTLTCRVEHLALGSPVEYNKTLNIHAPPKVSLELNPSQLVEGMGLVTVVTCIAREGHPAASITWSGLDQGSSIETTETEPDGKVTVRSEYRMEPTKESQGRTLTCRVEHPALKPPLVELSTKLDIHYKPSVSITGYDGDWYVDKKSAYLTCEADANPKIKHYLWDRQEGSLPNGTVVSGNSLSFERPLLESDSGSFSCWANNSVGWGEAVVIITIRSGTTTAATTTATTTTTSTTPVAATTPGGVASDEPWIIAVAVIVPLLVLAAVAASVFFFCKKKGTQATKKRKHGRDAPVGSAHQLNDHTNNDVETHGAQPHGKGAPIGQQIPSENKTTEYAEVTVPPPGKDNLTDGGLNGKPNRGYEDNPAGSGRKQSPQAAPATIYAELNKENLAKKRPVGFTSADKPTSSNLQAEDDYANGQQHLQKPKPNIAPKPRKDSQNNNYCSETQESEIEPPPGRDEWTRKDKI